MQNGAVCQTSTGLANQCRCFRELRWKSGERTRLACTFRRLAEIALWKSPEEKFAMARAPSPAREARALPKTPDNPWLQITAYILRMPRACVASARGLHRQNAMSRR